MALISINNLSFHYEGSHDNIFEDASFQIDTDWKLGFVGRNGRGKTTFLQLLMGKHEYCGKITSAVRFDYFPFEIKGEDADKTAYELAEQIIPDYEQWAFDRELNLIEVSEDKRRRRFSSLSGGERTRIMLAILFLCDDNYLLIDEPTNHLDLYGRHIVSRYLCGKKGFILVSHDREFLDGCVDHILSINKANIEVQRGNFSQWLESKERQDSFEIAANERLAGEIDRLKKAARQKSGWSVAAEGKKRGAADKGFMGAKAARQMKTAKAIEQRREKAVEDKVKLLKNIENAEALQISPLWHTSERLIEVKKLAVYFDDKKIFDELSFEIARGERVAIRGRNGTGKSSLLKLLAGFDIEHSGEMYRASGLRVSYVPQDTSFIKGQLKDFAGERRQSETELLAMLFRLGLERKQFEKDMSDFSDGQKKKVLLASSLCEQAHLYIWDEPLNYIDIISRMQLEKVIREQEATLVFVEHDKAFSDAIASKEIELKKADS